MIQKSVFVFFIYFIFKCHKSLAQETSRSNLESKKPNDIKNQKLNDALQNIQIITLIGLLQL
jgi:hypothetical protein